MKTTVLIGLVWAMVGTCSAEQVLAEYDWSKLATGGELLGGVPVTEGGRAVLKIVNTNSTPLRTQLFKVIHPSITKNLYALVGEIKYEGVNGAGYLEMWNYFPPTQPGAPEAGYFSRTLGESGEMGKITGTSSWRAFMLPFDRTGATAKPVRLEISLSLPAQGTVYLSSIKLVEYNGGFDKVPGGAANPWWPDWAGGAMGGLAGVVLGCLGGLHAWLAAHGRARGFVLMSSKVLIGLGVLSAVIGFVALSQRQPYGVWLLPLLLGVLLLAILPLRLKEYRRRYEDLELRKMVAMDA